jgi:hypothetical protein
MLLSFVQHVTMSDAGFELSLITAFIQNVSVLFVLAKVIRGSCFI